MDTQFDTLFHPLTLNNGVVIKNRLVVAPMTLFAADHQGNASAQTLRFLAHRGENMGIFITEAALVADGGAAFSGQFKAVDHRHLDSLKQVANTLKSQGCKAILQIYHGGGKAKAALNDGKTPLAPSDTPEASALSDAQIGQLIAAFGQAAKLAIEAGFDGVEIHGANGYLIQQFTSPQTNHRTDRWGGTRQNRLAFALALVDKVDRVRQDAKRSDFIIGYRFSPEEGGDDGLTMTDSFALIDALADKPLQYLHVSLWDFYKKARRGADTSLTRMQLIYEHLAGRLPLIGVGNLCSGEKIHQAWQHGWCDLLAFGKAVMLNANLATLLQQNTPQKIQTRLNPTRADQYDIPDALWAMCQKGDQGWLPPIEQ